MVALTTESKLLNGLDQSYLLAADSKLYFTAGTHGVWRGLSS